MLRPARQEPPARQPPWLRRADQAILGSVGILSLVGLTALWYLRGGAAGELVEYEQLPRGNLRFEIDINTAPWTELCELPRIGPALARRIIEQRQQQGPFRSSEDLLKVRGIGPKTLEGIRPYLAPVRSEEPR